MATWQFVADMVTATPTVLLDINSASTGMWVGDGYGLSPAPYDKGWAGNPMRHGSRLVRSSSPNRKLHIPIKLNASTNQVASTTVQTLGLLLRTDGILKYQASNVTNPVFFRTFADPDYAIDVIKTLIQNATLTLELDCEPFAYSPRVEVTGSPFTLSNDPAAGRTVRSSIWRRSSVTWRPRCTCWPRRRVRRTVCGIGGCMSVPAAGGSLRPTRTQCRPRR